jgi:ribose 5-phosphate isomerase A
MTKTTTELDAEKRLAASAALRWVKSGMVLGLGSGSTAHYFIELLGERVHGEALRLAAIASSRESEELARQYGIRTLQPSRGLRIDLTVDGADEIDPNLNLIKGGGGALLREKVVARASRYFLVLADSSKRVQRLGRFPLPVEVIPFSLPWVMDEVDQLGGAPRQRMIPGSAGEPFTTDQGNYVLDCKFASIEDPQSLVSKLDKIPGIAEHGLFLGYAAAALIAEGSDLIVLRPGSVPRPISDFESLP